MISLRTFSASASVCLLSGMSLEGAITLSASADNNTVKSAPDTVVTDTTSFALKEATSAQTNARIGYVKFDTTGVTSAEHGTTATLTLATSVAAGTSFSISVFALNTGVANYNWTEGNLTWNTSPALGASANNYVDPTKATLAGTATVANGAGTGTAFSVNLLNWQNFVQVDQSITFIVVVTSQSSGTPTLSLHSSESASPSLAPALSIIPEPGSTLLLAFGAFGLVRRRR